MKNTNIVALGYDLSTTALSVVGRTGSGEEAFVSVPMSGATTWKGQPASNQAKLKGQPAFDLAKLPELFSAALRGINSQGFEFASDGVISGSVRQHDMVLLDRKGRLLMPALSWQCNAATEEVETLKRLGAEAEVGRLEPRLILPKLLWALNQEPGFRSQLGTVMTTGDYIAMQLTGAQTLCSSEGVSNGLLNQSTRKIARSLIDTIPGMSSGWFPPVINSGQVIKPTSDPIFFSRDWDQVRHWLPGWRVVAGLGDNHAGAVGSGLIGRHTIVVSAGTSGTVTRAVKLNTPTVGQALKFAYYDDTLLLLMMADCASWYERFVAQFAKGRTYAELDSLAQGADSVYRHYYPETPETPFEPWFHRRPLQSQAATMQYSIAHYLAALFKEMTGALTETDGEHAVQRVVLTGGLTRSQYFCNALTAKIRDHGFLGEICLSSRVGPLANQAATLGALINAMVGGGLYSKMETAIKELCPSRPI